MVVLIVGLVLLCVAFGILIVSVRINRGNVATSERLIANAEEFQGVVDQMHQIADDLLVMMRDGTSPEELSEKIGELRRATAGMN